MANKNIDQYDDDNLHHLWDADQSTNRNPTEAQKKNMWRGINRATKTRGLRWSRLVAASITLFIALGLAMWLYQSKNNIFSSDLLIVTAGNASKTILLPDSSTVILSDHSSLQYPKSFSNRDSRRVMLSGEAVFNIKHTGRGFIVESGKVETKVLGTIFKVTARKELLTQQVALYEGKVRVGKTGAEGSLLKPGDLWVFDSRTDRNEVRENKASRMDLHLTFDNTPLTEAIEQIQTLYQIEVVNKLSPLSEIPKISGTFYYSTAQQSLEELAFPFGLTINKVKEQRYEIEHRQ